MREINDYTDAAREYYGDRLGDEHYTDEAITERLYKSYAKDRNNGETHEDMAHCYGSDAEEFLKRYDAEQAEHSALMAKRTAA